MSNSRALLLLPLAAAMLGLSALDAPIVAAIGVLGLAERAERVAPVVAAGLAAGGFVVLVGVLVTFVGNTSRTERLRPYREALRPFAAEFGRGVGETPDGLEIRVQRDGQWVEVQLDARPGGRLVVRSAPPARQALAWVGAAGPAPAAAANWREVERSPTWQMRAELPAMARPLLADGALMEVVGRFFARKEAGSVTHTLAGMVIDGAVPSAQDVDGQVRACAEIAFRLRRVNG